MAPVRVLLVDDVADIRDSVRMILEYDERFEVVGEAADGATGLEKAAETDPDIVLLDLAMPDMDGLEALPRFAEAAPDASVVVFTGFREAKLGTQAKELGAQAYIEKGIDLDGLVGVLWTVGEPHTVHTSSKGDPEASPT